MSVLAWIPSLIKKIVGYSCSLFLLGWGAYDWVESKLNANNEVVITKMRLERSVQIGEIKTEIDVVKNDIGWIKSSVDKMDDKLDTLIRMR